MGQSVHSLFYHTFWLDSVRFELLKKLDQFGSVRFEKNTSQSHLCSSRSSRRVLHLNAALSKLVSADCICDNHELIRKEIFCRSACAWTIETILSFPNISTFVMSLTSIVLSRRSINVDLCIRATNNIHSSYSHQYVCFIAKLSNDSWDFTSRAHLVYFGLSFIIWSVVLTTQCQSTIEYRYSFISSISAQLLFRS
jgi:hypothetical protein